MSQERRDLVYGNTREQILDHKGVPEHMGMATLSLAIELSDAGQLEQSAIAALPVGHYAFG